MIASFIIHYLGWQAERDLGGIARNGDKPAGDFRDWRFTG